MLRYFCRFKLIYRGAMPVGIVSDAFSEEWLRYRSEQSIFRFKRGDLRFSTNLATSFLHTRRNDVLVDPVYLDRSGSTFYVDDIEEREANQFAETLLFGDSALSAAVGLYGRDIPRVGLPISVCLRRWLDALKRF